MQIIRHMLHEDVDMVQRAIERIRFFEPNALQMHENGYYVAYSGGKDSAVIAELCRMAGVKFELVNNHTTVDPPELVYHVRREFERYRAMGIPCSVNMPMESMWQLIARKCTVPTRKIRYCCDVFKEAGGEGRFVITGVRWAESESRKSKSGMFQKNKKDENGKYIYVNDNEEAKRMIEQCPTKGKLTLNPIIDWTDEEVWAFLRGIRTAKGKRLERKELMNRLLGTRKGMLRTCKLYDEGHKRLGCIGCPLTGADQMDTEFKKWPKYERAYMRAFSKMLAERERKKMDTYMHDIKDADGVMLFFKGKKKYAKQEEGQTDMFNAGIIG